MAHRKWHGGGGYWDFFIGRDNMGKWETSPILHIKVGVLVYTTVIYRRPLYATQGFSEGEGASFN